MSKLLKFPTLLLAMVAGGCTAPNQELYPPSDPSIRIPAAKRAVRDNDRRLLSELFTDLSHEDPATRLFAIQALQRMTGERLGYLYYAADEERQAAVQRWRRYLSSLGVELPASRPASSPATRSAD